MDGGWGWPAEEGRGGGERERGALLPLGTVGRGRNHSLNSRAVKQGLCKYQVTPVFKPNAKGKLMMSDNLAMVARAIGIEARLT